MDPAPLDRRSQADAAPSAAVPAAAAPASGPPGDKTQRSRFLQRMLDDQERGRLHPVDHYVQDYPAIAEFVRSEHATFAQAATMSPSQAIEEEPLRKGDCVGRYELIRRLGEGGMSTVYLARDPKVGRDVVVKALRSGWDVDDPAHERLRREARVLGRLDHPALSKVLDLVEAGHRTYLVLPFHDGQTLATFLAGARAGREPTDTASEQSKATLPLPLLDRRAGADRASALRVLLDYFALAAEALHAAHGIGVVHRDLKPQNLMVLPDGSPMVIDFGLAVPDGERLTIPGELLGTPLYMSPEQIEGKARIDARSDVYSLGVTLYEALTLAHPFAGAEGREAVFHRILRGDPVPPRAHRTLIPRDLEAVVLKAMDREPGRRYSDALAFARELRRVIEMEPTEARPMSGMTIWLRRAARKPRRTAAVLALGLMTIAAVAANVESMGAKRRIEHLVAERKVGIEARKKAAMTLGLVLDWCAFLDATRPFVAREQELQDYDVLEQRCYEVSPPLGACRVLMRRGGLVYGNDLEGLQDICRRYDRLLATWPDLPRKVWVHWEAARWYAAHAQDPRRAIAIVDDGLALLDRLAPQWDGDVARGIAADREFWVTERRREPAAGVDDTRAQGLLLRGSALAAAGELTAAVAAFDQCAELFAQTGNVHRLANALANRAEQLVVLGEFARANADALRAAELYENGFTDPGPDSLDRPGNAAVRQRDQQGVDCMRKLQARIALSQGRPSEALAIVAEPEQDNPNARTSWQNCDLTLITAECLLRQGGVGKGAEARIRELLQEGRAFYESRNMQSLLVDADCIEGELLRMQQDESGAQRCFARARTRLDVSPDPLRAQRVQRLVEAR